MVNIELSERKNKKLKAKVGDKWVHFGGPPGSMHYRDSTGLLPKSQEHGDKERRKRYLARAKGIKDKNGNLTWKDKTSPNYWAIRYLWSG